MTQVLVVDHLLKAGRYVFNPTWLILLTQLCDFKTFVVSFPNSMYFYSLFNYIHQIRVIQLYDECDDKY